MIALSAFAILLGSGTFASSDTPEISLARCISEKQPDSAAKMLDSKSPDDVSLGLLAGLSVCGGDAGKIDIDKLIEALRTVQPSAKPKVEAR